MKIILQGMIIGIANIIPGVSGGTMAVILKVYDKIINAVAHLKSDFKNSLSFLIPIGIGGVLGILAFSNIIKYTLEHFYIATNLTFIGLILGSVPMIFKNVNTKPIKVSHIIVFVISLLIMLSMKFISPSETVAITELSVLNFAKLFFSSIIASAAMIIPGISGSFIMLLLGVYTTILTAISDFNITLLIPVGLGCITGILLCAKILDILFKKSPQSTYSAILGLMIGSMFILFPSVNIDFELLVGILCLALAGITSYLFSRK